MFDRLDSSCLVFVVVCYVNDGVREEKNVLSATPSQQADVTHAS